MQSWDGHRPASLRQVERSHIEHFLEQLEGRGLKPSTINTLVGCVQRFSGPLLREEQLAVSPVRAQHYLHEPEPLPRARSDEQVQRFLAGIEPVLERAGFLLLLRSGMRLGEVVALELGDGELEHPQLYLRRGHKNHRGRVVYFSAAAGQALQRGLECRWSQPLLQLFHNRYERPLHHRWVQRHFRADAERAGLERHLTVHSLRHTFACQLLNAGVDLVTLQELLGHDSILMTQRSARLSDRRRRAAYFEALTHMEQEVHNEPRAAQRLSPLPAAA